MNNSNRFVDEETPGGEFVAVQILLGILIGFSGLAPDVFRSLQSTERRSFWEFVRGLRPRRQEGTSVFNDVHKDLLDGEAISWNELCNAVMSVKNAVETRDVQDRLRIAFDSAEKLEPYRSSGSTR